MDLRDWLGTAVDRIGSWQAEYGQFDEHASTTVTDAEFEAPFGEVARQLSVLSPSLRRADGQTTTPGRDRRLPDRDAD
jgi:hypothetical protein